MSFQPLKMAASKLSGQAEPFPLFPLPCHSPQPQKHSLAVAQLFKATCIETERKKKCHLRSAFDLYPPKVETTESTALAKNVSQLHLLLLFGDEDRGVCQPGFVLGLFSACFFSGCILLPPFQSFAFMGFASSLPCCLLLPFSPRQPCLGCF